MKLYIKDDEVLFDYSDVDTQAKLDKGAIVYRHFIRESGCEWESTLRPKLKRMVFEHCSSNEPYIDASRRSLLAHRAYYTAVWLSIIEISDDFKPFLDRLDARCEEFQREMIAKEKERERKRHWQWVCNHGCGQCSNLRRWNDDYVCMASRDFLPEKNVPGNAYGQHLLFNYVPFPTENCPLNTDKKERV